MIAIPLALGFFGGFHCLGMCGPISLAVPWPTRSTGGRLMAGLVYNTGRIFTYASMGVAFGFMGSHFRMAGWQRSVSMAIGVMLLVWALYSLIPGVKRRITIGAGLSGQLSHLMSRLLKARRMVYLPILGMLNGLLPCGLVYMAIAGSVMTYDPWRGGMFMAFFGLGTLPFMLAVPFLAAKITPELRARIRRLYPWMVLVLAVLFFLRGMNLDIPFLSPKIDFAGGLGPGCE